MKAKLLFISAALLLSSALSAQTVEQDRERARQARERAEESRQRALERAEQVREEALERAQEARERALERSARALASIQAINDTVLINAGRHRVVVVEHNDDGSRTEVAYFKEKPDRERTSYRHRSLHGGVMIDMGFNIYDPSNIFSGAEGDDDFISQNTSQSFGFALYPFYGNLAFNRARTVGLTSGLGLDWANYRFDESYTVANIDGITLPALIRHADDVKKSKLTSLYLNVPVMMHFGIPVGRRNNYSNRINIEMGVIGGLKLGAHTKIKYYGGAKDKERDAFNFNVVRYQLTARVGYGPVMAFANYQMTPMFKKGHGAELYPYTVGLSFAFH